MLEPGLVYAALPVLLRQGLILGLFMPAVADLLSPLALWFLMAKDYDVPPMELFFERILKWLYAFWFIVGFVVDVIGLDSLLAFDAVFNLLYDPDRV